VIIGIAGKKRAGKTTAADALEAIDFERQSFAATLKLMARILMRDCGMNEEQIIDAQTHKEQPMPILGVSYRHLCQTLGTDWGRKMIHSDLWVIAAKHKMMSCCDVVFDDVRFENEAHMIRQAGGQIIHIRREQTESCDAHESERGVSVLRGDIVIRNDGTISELEDKVYDVVDVCLGLGK
jgi:hypothetical protein